MKARLHLLSATGLVLFVSPLLTFISHGDTGKPAALKALVLSLTGLLIAFLAVWCNFWMRRMEQFRTVRVRPALVCIDVTRDPPTSTPF